jgi:glycosyltransferase involved in cell wall biosynthesis
LTELKLFDELSSEFNPDSFTYSASLMKNVCVVLTAYNDQEAIGQAVKEFLSQRNVISVIVIDNNSEDKTAKTAFKAGAKVIREYNQGYGFACKRGLNEALLRNDADVVVLAEGDMTFRGRDIWKLLPFLDDADMVVGSRTHKAFTDQNSQMDWFYCWGNLFIAKILELRFFDFKFQTKARFTDVGCTMRAINKKALMEIIDDLRIGSMHFSPHMIQVALEHDLNVVEVPITFRKRVGPSKGAGGNKFLGFRIGLNMLWEMLKR